MTRQHARAHFWRVEALATRRKQLAPYLTGVDPACDVMVRSARFQRLCRADALYRVVGYI